MTRNEFILLLRKADGAPDDELFSHVGHRIADHDALCFTAEGAAMNDKICGFCNQPGADKIPHPVRWPGEESADTEYVHATCEYEECRRAHALLSDKQREQFLRSVLATPRSRSELQSLWRITISTVMGSIRAGTVKRRSAVISNPSAARWWGRGWRWLLKLTLRQEAARVKAGKEQQ